MNMLRPHLKHLDSGRANAKTMRYWWRLYAIKNLINEYPTNGEKIAEILASHKRTIETLGSRELKDWHNQKNYSEELRNLIGNQDVRRILMTVTLCLWVARNDIFHGGLVPTHEKDFIRECSQILERIYRECFCSYVGLAWGSVGLGRIVCVPWLVRPLKTVSFSKVFSLRVHINGVMIDVCGF